jgi:hypothetical protein
VNKWNWVLWISIFWNWVLWTKYLNQFSSSWYMTGNLACNIENSLNAIHDHILKFAWIASTAVLHYQMCEENARIASVDTWWVMSITGDSQLKLQLLCTKVSENLIWIYCTSDGWVERSQADRNLPHKSTRDILCHQEIFPSFTIQKYHTCCQRKAWSFLCPWKQHSTKMIIGSHPIFHPQE